MKIPEEKLPIISTANFDVLQWDGIGLFKVCWTIVASYGLLEEFKVPNETFFTFLQSISQTYNKVPYHNWRHACDVTQFVNYEIKLAKMDTVFNKFELFGIFVSSICHDANHDGFQTFLTLKLKHHLEFCSRTKVSWKLIIVPYQLVSFQKKNQTFSLL